jgi:mRNA interferase YafQ
LKKTADSKRAAMPRAAEYAKTFEKDWQNLSRSGRYDLHRLKEVILLLISNDEQLPPDLLDHPLKGGWSPCRECHVGGDFLLIYRIDGNLVTFIRAGTHADLFNK